MKISGAFPSKYLKAANLEGREKRVTIESIAMEAMEQTKEENIFVAVGPAGQLAINESPVAGEAFTALLAEKLRQSRYKLVVIRADVEAQSGAVIDVLNIAKKAGARRITFGTEEIVEQP